MNLRHVFYKRGPFVALLIGWVACTQPSEKAPTYTWSPVEINQEIKHSDKIEAIIAPYRAQMDSIMNEEIGYASHDLTTQGIYETTLGAFVTDLVLKQSEATYSQDVDVVIMNHHGGLRASINEGPITLGEVFEVMPFENEVILLTLSGSELQDIIQYIADSKHSMIWPVSFHIADTGVENILISGEAIRQDKNYVLSTNDYVANGGSGFSMLKPLQRLDITPVKLRDMIVLEIRQQTAQGDSIKKEVAHIITTSAQ